MFGFIKNLVGVNAEKTGNDLMEMLVSWNPRNASEAERRTIADALSEFCLKCEEARVKLEKEDADVVKIKKEVSDQMALAKKWQSEIQNPETDSGRRSQLEERLPGLMTKLGTYGPRIDKEVKEAEMARRLFDTYDQVVRVTNEKLKQKSMQADQAATDLEIAKAEQLMAREQVNAARVLAGLKTATDSFDIASSAMSKQAEKTRAKTAAMQREADLLAGLSDNSDSFMEAEMAKVRGGKMATSIEDQLAALQAKLK